MTSLAHDADALGSIKIEVKTWPTDTQKAQEGGIPYYICQD